MNDWYVISTARNWVASVVHQGQRVLELERHSFPPDDENQFLEWARVRPLKPDFTHIEDHFFVTTVHKSVEWLVEAHNRQLLDPNVTEAFLAAASQSRLVRNIREHHLEYLNGGGRQRGDNFVVIDINDGNSTAHIDASSVIITDEGRLIGGRINVQALMNEASALHPALFEQQNIIMQRDAQQNIP